MGVLIEGQVTESDWAEFIGGETYHVRLYQDGHWTLEAPAVAGEDRPVALPPDGQSSIVVGGEGSPAPSEEGTPVPPASGAG